MRALVIMLALLATPAIAGNNENFDGAFSGSRLDSAGGGLEGRTLINKLTGHNYWDLRSRGEVYSRDPGGAPNHGPCNCGR